MHGEIYPGIAAGIRQQPKKQPAAATKRGGPCLLLLLREIDFYTAEGILPQYAAGVITHCTINAPTVRRSPEG